MQRVVVTGLGAVTPLGLGKLPDRLQHGYPLTLSGVQRSWRRLVEGGCGIVSLKGRKKHDQQQCQVAGLIPQGKKEEGGWTASEWLSSDEQRRMSTFMQYAMAASKEALEDANWFPETATQQEMTVSR